MTLGKAYRNKWDEKPLIKDIVHMRLQCGRLELVTIHGDEKVILGDEIEVDFATGRILLGEHYEAGKESAV